MPFRLSNDINRQMKLQILFAFIFWLTIVFVFGTRFECTDHNYNCTICNDEVIICVRNGFQRMFIFSPFLLQLNLSYNVISQLKSISFNNLPLLQNLDLSHNRVSKLYDRTFAGLGSLRLLNLAHNKISYIQKDSFKNLHELQVLQLEGNPLSHLNGDVFYDLHSLNQLHVIETKTLEDDRALLCACKHIKKLWNVVDGFAFCKTNGTIKSTNIENCSLIGHQLIDEMSKDIKLKEEQIEPDEPNLNHNYDNFLKLNEAKSPPMLIKVPEMLVRVHSGDSLTWKCEVSGNPLPFLKWVKDGRTLTYNGTLHLYGIMPNDEGTYECVASNELGVAAKQVILYVIGGIVLDSWSKEVTDKFRTMSNESIINGNNYVANYLRNVTHLVETVRLLLRTSDGGTNFSATVDDVQSDWLTPVQQMIMVNYTSCVGGSQVQVLDCRQYSQYRSVTGICNNRLHPNWGSQMIPFVRWLPSRYEDRLIKPVGWFSTRLYNGYRLPNARMITKHLLSTDRLTPDPQHNHMLMQFGQFLDHDLTFTAPARSWNILENNVIDCRKTCHHHVEPCFSVERHATNCIEVIRSAELCGSGLTSLVHGRFIAREQVNQLTAFIDGSNIYGSTIELARYIRDLNSDVGHLKTTQVFNRSYLPLSDDKFPIDCQLQPNGSLMECFLSGDHRANEQLGLLTFHNVWLRQHNRLATRLKQINPKWNGDQIYEETRKIVGAQLQVITYRDWLPQIIGQKGMKLLGEYRNYNPYVNPSIANVFATAAMRFGHTLVNTHLIRQFVVNSTSKNRMKLRKLFFASHLLFQPNIHDTILNGLLSSPLKKPMPEQAISNELTEHLFELSRNVPLDLASINIQRGRDHALPAYNQWRIYCGLNRAETFDQFQTEIRNEHIRIKLEQLYGHPDNVDLWVGAILENVDNDAKVGPTFRCLLAEQFKKLRDGDRHFYKNINMFNQEQIMELEKTTLSQIICSNSDQIYEIQPDAFMLSSNQSKVSCEQVPDLDLSKWFIADESSN